MKVNLPTTQHFCDLYWQKQKQNLIRARAMNSRTYVSQHGGLSIVNKFLVGLGKYLEFNMPKIIHETDIDFCCLKPTKQKMVLWRGIEKPKENSPTYYYFKKSLDLGKGDIIYLPGYIFATSDKNLAQFCACPFSKSKGKGIVYKINVPQGAHISHYNHYTFPRNSEFVCTDSCAINDGNKFYQLISLDYIKPNKYDNNL